MDILGLVNALMLGVVISILTANSYEDMLAVDERYATDPQLAKYWNTWYDLPPSVMFQRDIYNSMIFLFVCLITIIFMYADSLAKIPADGTDETEEEKKVNMEKFSCWWEYAKWGIMVCIYLTGTGIIYAIFAGQDIQYIKYVDYYLLDYGKISYTDPHDTVGYASSTFRVTFGVAACIVILACGFGTAAKYSREDDDEYHLHLAEAIDTLEKRIKNKHQPTDWEKKYKDVDGRRREVLLDLYKRFFYFLVARDLWLDLHNLYLKMVGENASRKENHVKLESIRLRGGAEAKDFETGTQVEVNSHGKKRLEGTISNKNDDGTFEITYDKEGVGEKFLDPKDKFFEVDQKRDVEEMFEQVAYVSKLDKKLSKTRLRYLKMHIKKEHVTIDGDKHKIVPDDSSDDEDGISMK